jgi:hypothetical protein
MLIAYINASLLTDSFEERNEGQAEINSVFELISVLITGDFNDIDEDGDFPGSHSIVKTVRTVISPQFSHMLFSRFPDKTEKMLIHACEIMPRQPVRGQIDHPPQNRFVQTGTI